MLIPLLCGIPQRWTCLPVRELEASYSGMTSFHIKLYPICLFVSASYYPVTDNVIPSFFPSKRGGEGTPHTCRVWSLSWNNSVPRLFNGDPKIRKGNREMTKVPCYFVDIFFFLKPPFLNLTLNSYSQSLPLSRLSKTNNGLCSHHSALLPEWWQKSLNSLV